MSDGKVFTDGTKKSILDVVEKAIEVGPVLELVDVLVAKGILDVLDHVGDKFIPDNLDEDLNLVAELCLQEEWELAGASTGSLLNKLIDIPVLEEASEELVFTNGFKFLVSLIKNYIEKKKVEDQ